MDEFDGMTRIAQDALRNIMEIYSDNVFFVLTCNNINRIIQPIQSRCVLISFAYPSKVETAKFLSYICNNEKMDYSEEGLRQLIELNYPSIRNCVIALQDLYTNGQAVTIENVKPAEEVYEEMWKMLQEKRWKEIKEYVMKSNVDARELNAFFWQKALDTGQLKTIQICCRNERDLSYGADEKIILCTSLMEMCK
jgi:DNA polymerase III delta prime subunit